MTTPGPEALRASLLLGPVANFEGRMLDEKRRLLEQADRCRRIAQSTMNAEAAAMLLCIARSYEAQATLINEAKAR